jgi:hypothetical protein
VRPLADGCAIPALPVPVVPEFRAGMAAGYPALGEANDLVGR